MSEGEGLSKSEIKEAVAEGVREVLADHRCNCFLDAEEKQIIKDAATGGKYFKRAVLVGLVLVALGALGLKWLKPFVGK